MSTPAAVTGSDTVPAPPRRSGGAHPVAVVTGANHGIGAATARHLAATGAHVLVAGLPIEDERDPATPAAYYTARARDPELVAETIRADGGRAVAAAVDLADDDAARRLYDRAEEAFDAPVRILVHNATGWVGDSFRGGGTDHAERTVRPVTPATFDQQFAVDARAGALLIAEHARRHRQRGDDWGRIVTLTSGGPDGFPSEASYGAAKAALDNYAMTAAAELGELGITANALMPPVTDTGWVTDPVRDFVASSWGHQHVASPEEVAGVVAWLCSDASWLVTGNRIVLR
ncbi:SDR family NAD(P)-dependent oxidoreductase [Egicoccus sp. AB-alg2]|uniref:SDR family NAD(P)-dependent oxidoreductase n=1 Tax=Egicoccus sp. AB-alg2 TaxID=3242693 RepID=UPI00359D0BFC